MSDQAAIPPSWIECTLGDLVEYGSTRKAEPSEIAAGAWVLELEDIERDTSRVLQRVTFAERQSKSTKNRFSQGDVLYGKLRPYLNKVVRASDSGYCTTEIVPLSPPPELDGGYLFHWLKHPRFLEYVTAVSHGLNMPRLGTEAGKAAPFILAPLPEQKRVADKLDAVFARLNACRERLDRVPAILKRFRQSVLAAATSGELTREWREAQGLDIAWEPSRLGAVGSVTGGITKNAGRANASLKRKYLRVANVYANRLELEDIAEIATNEGEFARTRLRKGDVLIVEGNEKSTTGLHTLSLSKVSAVLLLVPPLDEQREVVRRVEALFDFATRLEGRLARAQELVALTTPSALAKAFRGELVPQDPDDEPATELLERICSRVAVLSTADKPKRAGARDQRTKAKAHTDMLTRKDVAPTHLTGILKERGALTAEALWTASQLEIDEFYDQLKDEEAKGLLRENLGDSPIALRLLEAAA